MAHLNLALTLSDLNKKDEAVAILMKIPKIGDDGTKDPLSHVTTQVLEFDQHKTSKILLRYACLVVVA